MNAMLLAGLVAALLVVIDEAVVSVDNIASRLRRRRAEGSAKSLAETILEASLEVRSAAVYGTLAVTLATLPLFFLNSVAGSFFPHIAIAFLVTLGAAMLAALTVTPALAVLLLSNERPKRESPLVRWLQVRYARVLTRLVMRRSPAYVAMGLVVVAGIAAAPFLKQSLLPTFKESTLLIRWGGPPGTSLPEMDRITARASAELR